MSKLLELADRVEALTGPDRAIDRDIADALGLGPDDTWERPRSDKHVKRMDEGSWIKNGLIRDAKRYTASIDAAMTLVPGSYPSRSIGATDDGRGYAMLAGNDGHMMVEDPDEFYVEADAATPALALCAASLRARHAVEGEGRG